VSFFFPHPSTREKMPDPPPKGIFPFFLKQSTLQKLGMKTGEAINDTVEYKFIPKEDIMKEIQMYGVMSDFEPAKKVVESYQGEKIMIYVDRANKYGDDYALIYSDEAKEEILKEFAEREDAVKEQLLAQLKAEEEKRAAEYARLNAVYEDKPIEPHPWSSSTLAETENEIRQSSYEPSRREVLSTEIIRPKRFTKQAYRLYDRNSDVGGIAEFRSQKDPNFKSVKESDRGIQVAAMCSDSSSQTTYYRSVNKAVQYESVSTTAPSSSSAPAPAVPSSSSSANASNNTAVAGVGTSTDTADLYNDNLLAFLEKATIRIEQALQQNESVDIFHETFRLLHDEEGNDSSQADNELRELRNFADANYSKSKALAAVDWMPKAHGMVAVSAVRNISFDQRIPILGQTHTSYIMLWDFRLLVKPLVLMQSHHEIFTFRFNRTDNGYLVGGCITGQVILWEITDAINLALKKNNRGSSSSSSATAGGGGDATANGNGNTASGGQDTIDDDEQELLPVLPKLISSVDHSHKKCVSDLFWLPPTTQLNFRGQIVGDEHLDGHSYQFITVAGDGMIMVWDIRYEKIFNDELKHIARPKHMPTEKSSNKGSNANTGVDGGSSSGSGIKPLWGPIFKTHLKRLEGVGELSLCRVCETTSNKSSSSSSMNNIVGSKSNGFSGDSKSQFMIATEEGDLIFADLSVRKSDQTATSNAVATEDEENEISCVRWITMDHPRPSVYLHESPFFPNIILTISDWYFHIWKIGEDRPLFTSPLSNSYLTSGSWSATRPAVIFIASGDGNILVWDFTDSSFHPSIELKAAHAKITSMEIYTSSRHQMLAVGDEMGTLHIFEMPRNLTKPVHKEESMMMKFLERELQVLLYFYSNLRH
jgi:hypothetical protein